MRKTFIKFVAIIYPLPVKFILTGFLLSCFLFIKAQEWDYSYTHYTKSDGLPSNTIYCVTSDKNGVLWLGTDAGVVKFDGYKMKVFNTDDGLPSNDVFEIVCDSKNRLWLTTFKSDITFISKGIIHTSKNDPLISAVKNQNQNPRYFEDSDSNLWIRTTKFELFKIDKNETIKKIEFPFETKEAGYNITEYQNKLYFFSSLHTFFYDMQRDKLVSLDSLQIKRTEGLAIFNGNCYYINENKTISKSTLSDFTKGYYKGLSSYWNIPIIDSTLWVPSQKGFILYDLRNLANTEKVLSKYPISFCHKDNQENIWVSSLSNGLFKLNSRKIINFTNGDLNNKIIFTSLYVDNANLYAGTNKGDLYCFNRQTLKLFKSFSIEVNSISNIRILKILKDPKLLSLATDKGIYKQNLLNGHVQWISMNTTSLKNYFKSNNTTVILDHIGVKYYINDILKDSLVTYKRYYSYCEYNDKKVVGSQDSLYYIDKVFKPYPLDIPFNYRAVDLLVKDSLLIATTAEKGVFFIKDSTVVKNMNISNGLSSNTCYKSVVYKDVLYTASNKGINIYDFKKDSLFHLFESDGLPSNTVFDLKVFNDTIYAATEGGLSIIPVSVILRHRSFPLFANPVIVNNDTIWNKPQSVSLYDEQPVILVLNGLSYGTKSPLKYYFRIASVDTNYHITSDPEIHLSNLSHGNYTLQAHAVNSDGDVSNEILISIHVKPHYYQTVLFYVLITLAIILSIYFFSIWMMTRIKRKEQQKMALDIKIQNLEHAAWKAAINPHFMYNSIQTLESLFLKNDHKNANKFASEFTSILRKTIDHSGKLFITVDDEIKYMKNFLELEIIKRGSEVDYSLIIDNEQTRGYYLPSLVIQPIVENSLKHGIKNLSTGIIKIIFVQKDNKLICTVQDNGVGFNETEIDTFNSKGIQLIRDKLAIVEKVIHNPIIFQFKNQTNESGEIIGTETIFKFPLNIQDYAISISNN